MLNLGLCRKCEKCEKYCPPVRSDEGVLVGLPSIQCKVSDSSSLENASLTWNSEIPSACVYLVEQEMTEDVAMEEYENMMEEIKEGTAR